MNICAIGDPNDLTLTYVVWKARQRGMGVLMLAEEGLGDSWQFCVDDHDPGSAVLVSHGSNYMLKELNGAYARFNPNPPLPWELELESEASSLVISERRAAIYELLGNMPFPVANLPCAGRENGSKPLQMQNLKRAGFEVPRWIATNSASSAVGFVRSCSSGAIYKACSGIRTHVKMVDAELVSLLEAGTSPVVVQEYIPGHDLRVHVVQNRTFATRIEAEGVDYRYSEGSKKYTAVKIPIALHDQCIAYTRASGLCISGIDFRVTSTNRYLCLEVNPMPTFLPYEMSTGQGICDALLDCFEQGHVAFQ